MMEPTPWYKTATWWFTLAASVVTALLMVKYFPNNSQAEKLLFAAQLVLGGLGFKASRGDVKEAHNMPSPQQQLNVQNSVVNGDIVGGDKVDGLR